MAQGRVLVVDDDPAVRSTVRELLADCGFETDAASDGDAGLARVEEFRPAVVVADVLMPGFGGLALLRELRARHPEVGVILMSGGGSIESALRAVRDEGALDYFEKPIDNAKLCAAVGRAVEESHARRGGAASGAGARTSFGKLI